jgi:hypothetical protein
VSEADYIYNIINSDYANQSVWNALAVYLTGLGDDRGEYITLGIYLFNGGTDSAKLARFNILDRKYNTTAVSRAPFHFLVSWQSDTYKALPLYFPVYYHVVNEPTTLVPVDYVSALEFRPKRYTDEVFGTYVV